MFTKGSREPNENDNVSNDDNKTNTDWDNYIGNIFIVMMMKKIE